MPVLLVISYICELDPTTSARVRRCSSLVHSLVPWAGNDVFRQVAIIDGILPDEFLLQASTWVSKFIARYPRDEIRSYWAKIGFSRTAKGMRIQKTRHPEVGFITSPTLTNPV